MYVSCNNKFLKYDTFSTALRCQRWPNRFWLISDLVPTQSLGWDRFFFFAVRAVQTQSQPVKVCTNNGKGNLKNKIKYEKKVGSCRNMCCCPLPTPVGLRVGAGRLPQQDVDFLLYPFLVVGRVGVGRLLVDEAAEID